MPTKVIAKNGDCLCGIAVEYGFIDCQPLRDVAENSAFLSTPLTNGDEVTVPDLVVEEFSKGVDAKHTFTIKSSPPFNIRFVHGSPSLPYREDPDLLNLHVSNFVTNLAGATGLKPFPAGYGFNEDGHQDPDTFKIEVWDPAAAGPVNVKLEALKPTYVAFPEYGRLTVARYTEFADAARKIPALVCEAVSTTTKNTFRSKYLRLVVDEADHAAPGCTDQLLLVTDMADGLGTGADTDNDSLEILDQVVRATYEIPRCPGSPKCKITKIVEIGGSERQLVRVHFHAFRKDPGVDTMPTGITAADMTKHLRRRTYKWYRRVFAQADLAPKLMSLNIIDPPAENMLCLSHGHGRAVATTGTNQIDFHLTTDTGDIPMQVVFAGGETPLEAGALIVSKLPTGFSGEALVCVRAASAANPACDVLIKATSGERVTLTEVQLSPGARMTVNIPRVDLMSVLSGDADLDGTTSWLSVDFKRILRDIPVTDDAMHCVVVGKFSTPSLRGQAFQPCLGVDAPFRPDLPFRASTIMAYTANSGPVLDGGDSLPFTSPHESAHTLCDLIHTKTGASHARTELLGSGTSVANAVTGTKRLCDGPYLVDMGQNLTTTMVNVQVRLTEQIRTKGAAKMESW
jgi:hypothetical protein